MFKRYAFVLALVALVVVPVMASANARLISVVSTSGGCVDGPNSPNNVSVQHWDVEPGETYVLTIVDAFECGNGGTDMTIDVRINSTTHGNTDLVATNTGAAGSYEFTFTMPTDAQCTFPIFYCTTPGAGNTGLRVIRDDGLDYQAHLRASTFDAGCTNPTPILGPYCDVVPTDQTNWGRIKTLYN